MTVLPPNSTTLERALADGDGAALAGVPVEIRDVWNPATCPAGLLPFLAWGVSIDLWNSEWTEAEKRAAIATAIEDQRRKGTPASLRSVIDRFDPLIEMVEWFEDRDTMDPHTFRLELPLAADTPVEYSEALIAALVRDIAAVKPLRSHMLAVHRLVAQAGTYLAGAAKAAGYSGLDGTCDLTTPSDPAWATYLQTEDGEPLRGADGAFLEAA